MRKIFKLLLVLVISHSTFAQEAGKEQSDIEKLVEMQKKLAKEVQQETAQSGQIKKDSREEMQAKLAKQGIEVSFDKGKEEKNIHPFSRRWKGEKLPPLQLTDLDGNQISSEDFEGKYLHINFWSTSCKPCIEEFPELDQIKEKYGDEQVIYLAIAPEVESKVRKVLAKHPVNYQVVANTEVLMKELGVDGYPKNLFIDKNGMIREATDGSHYTITTHEGEPKLVPDNFKIYDRIMESIVGQ